MWPLSELCLVSYISARTELEKAFLEVLHRIFVNLSHPPGGICIGENRKWENIGIATCEYLYVYVYLLVNISTYICPTWHLYIYNCQYLFLISRWLRSRKFFQRTSSRGLIRGTNPISFRLFRGLISYVVCSINTTKYTTKSRVWRLGVRRRFFFLPILKHHMPGGLLKIRSAVCDRSASRVSEERKVCGCPFFLCTVCFFFIIHSKRMMSHKKVISHATNIMWRNYWLCVCVCFYYVHTKSEYYQLCPYRGGDDIFRF